MQVLREEPLPEITVNARVRWAILCAQSALPDEAWTASWRDWAEGWLSGKDRSSGAAEAARAAARAVAMVILAKEWAAEAEAKKDLDLLALLKQAISDEAEYEKARAG